MTKEQFEREKMYQLTMNSVRRMLIAGLISDKEYCQIDTIFKQKYRPIFGGLCEDFR